MVGLRERELRYWAAAVVSFAILQSSVALRAEPTTLPVLSPTPTTVELLGGRIDLQGPIRLVVAPGTDPVTVDLVRRILTSAGAGAIETTERAPAELDRLYVVLGTTRTALIRGALARSRTALDGHTEGYTIVSMASSRGGILTLAGQDADGLFHAAQTLRQLARHRFVPALVIQDHPAMPIRGTIEGFYGKPWSMSDRVRHLDFLGRMKANTYVYSPKDDPYARDRWRETYPATSLSSLATVVAAARRNHVDFVYAISPGSSICFSDPSDLRFLRRKLDALRSIGVHSFYLALDDIEYTKWNCERDEATFGPSAAEAAAVAQSRLLNALQGELVARDPTARSLIMVPTEYYDAKESPYKAALRKFLDPRIVVQWTGTDVVPPAISVPDARSAAKAFGRTTLLWDNYPVNDYKQSAGRLLLAPYTRREAGLAKELKGILANPMNQEAPSRVAVGGAVAFAWNDRAYNAERTWYAIARLLAGGDERATAALLTFFDTQHLAPTFGSQPWQDQAPCLKALLDDVREKIAADDDGARRQAIEMLARRADQFASAPDTIRSGVTEQGFVEQSRPWLDAMQLWGRALQLTAAGLGAANQDSSAAPEYFRRAQQLAAEAASIPTLPGATRFGSAVKVADAVLDQFIADAPSLIAIQRPHADNLGLQSSTVSTKAVPPDQPLSDGRGH